MKKIKNYIFYAILLSTLMLIFLTSCTNQTYICPDGTSVNNPDLCLKEEINQETQETKILNEKFKLDSKELTDLIKLTEHKYVKAPQINEFEDESSIRNIHNTRTYEAFMNIILRFEQKTKYENSDLYIKILGADSNGNMERLMHQGILNPGENSIALQTIMQSQSENPRLKLCVGFTQDFDTSVETDYVSCFTLRLEAPKHDFSLTRQGATFDFYNYKAEINEIATSEKTTILKNNGNVPTTFFIYLPELNEKYTLSTNTNKIFLEPQQEKTLTFTGTWIYNGTKIRDTFIGGIYTIGHNCEISQECHQGARIRQSLTFEFKN